MTGTGDNRMQRQLLVGGDVGAGDVTIAASATDVLLFGWC